MMALTMRISLLANFDPPAIGKAWISVPDPNGVPLIAIATGDKTVRVYNLQSFKLHSTLEGGHARSVRSLAWKPKTRSSTTTLCIATGSFDATMGIWRREEGPGRDTVAKEEEKQIEEASVEDEATEYEIDRDGNVLAVPKLMNNAEEINEDWEFAIVLEGHDSEIKSVAYSPSGQFLASCSRDKSIWVWEEIGDEGDDDFETIAVLQDHTADVKCVTWRKDDGNGELLASGSYDDSIRLWRGDDEGEWSCVSVLEGHESTVWALAWEPEVSMDKFDSAEKDDEQKDHAPRIPRLLSSSADGTIRVWTQVPNPPRPNRPSYLNSSIPSTMRPSLEEETWKHTATLPRTHDDPVYSISWSTKTGRVASTAGDGKIVVYEEIIKGRSTVGGEIEREWVIVGVHESSHGPYETNHVTWCRRWDGGGNGEEEMLVTTGDDGWTKAWAVENLRNEESA